MLRAALFALLGSVLAPALATQVPLGPSNHDKHPILLGDDDRTEWCLDQYPDPNATHHLVFETAHSLLQHWPNTRMRNGKRYPRLFDSV